MRDQQPLLCVRCHQPVTIHRSDYDLFEQMHWLCFHLEFEHQADPDEPCSDPSCPRWHIEVFRAKLAELGYDPQEVLNDAINKRWSL
jgi:hypothetical protein